jgi:hypothetical protein
MSKIIQLTFEILPDGRVECHYKYDDGSLTSFDTAQLPKLVAPLVADLTAAQQAVITQQAAEKAAAEKAKVDVDAALAEEQQAHAATKAQLADLESEKVSLLDANASLGEQRETAVLALAAEQEAHAAAEDRPGSRNRSRALQRVTFKTLCVITPTTRQGASKLETKSPTLYDRFKASVIKVNQLNAQASAVAAAVGGHHPGGHRIERCDQSAGRDGSNPAGAVQQGTAGRRSQAAGSRSRQGRQEVIKPLSSM